MATVAFYEGEFRYRIVDPRGEIIEIECDDFKMRMLVETFERGMADAKAVIVKDRLARMERGQIVPLRTRPYPA